MKATKIPTEYILSDKEMKCLKTYNERQRRQFLASKAESMGCHGINRVCNAVGVCRDTLYRGKHELETDANESFPEGRVRAVGGGRTPTLEKHPEYLDVFDKIASLYTVGLPQDENVIWLTISTPQIIGLFKQARHQSVPIYRQTDEEGKRLQGALLCQSTDFERCQRQECAI